MTNPLMDGATNVPQQEATELPDVLGFNGGLNANVQATDNPTIDRHII